ncbi:Vi polysaccharide biosynthesis protein TviD [Legionella beliardensis]|uniref:Vi polysaccharide biosynthesis protein TviD n=1 Tax=Legionella beliardensis TaxID=91822 RepID=A0A378I062_9GAMM|nr:tetratricopeptide repeat protein [Legionella beliardensis]STX28035.1 Vi polysaccharide biosynthesis protein TviD [Legionella beliardensis]
MTIKITPIGSCRIHNPLKKFSSKPYLQLNTSDIYGFTHTSAEALQQLKYLQGDYLPSKDIYPILSARLRFNKNKLKQATPPSDLYFVEISSAKVAMVNDEYVQMNYIYVYFSEFFLEPERTKKFWSLAGRANREELLNFLQADPVYKSYPKDKQKLLSKISIRQMTADELQQDMVEIINRVKNVVFITHCNVKLPDMSYINSRDSWIKTIEKIGKEIGCKVYNPTHLMLVLGQSLSLQKNGLDSTHYTPLFESRIYNDLHRLYVEPLLNDPHAEEEVENDKNIITEELNHLEELYNQGELTTVLQQLNNLMRKHPKFAAAKEFFGRILYHLNDYERAIEIFKSLDENQELGNDGRLYLIKCHFNLKNFKDALGQADVLFEEEIYEPEVIKLSAMAAQALGERVKASTYWEQLYKFEDFKLEAASQQALLFEQENDFEKAIKWLNLALDVCPNDSNLISALNRMLASVADEKSLELLIERVSSISADEVISITRTALNHNFIITAAKGLLKAIELGPNEPQVKKIIASTSAEWLKLITDEKLRQQEPEQWLHYLSALLLVQPRQKSAIRIRRDYILSQRSELKNSYQHADYDKATMAGMNIFFLDPNFPGISLLIGRSFYAKDDYTNALNWLIKATTLDSNDKNAWILRAKAALKANNFIEALFTVQQMKLYFNENTHKTEFKNIIKLVLVNSLKQVMLFLEKGELELAWQINEALLAELPEDKKSLKARTLILRKMSEQLKEAESSEIQIKLAQSIYEKDPNNIQALRILAVALMKQKKLEESLSYWEKLCILSPEINSFKKQAQKCIESQSKKVAEVSN